MDKKVYTKVIYTISIRATQKVDDNTELVKGIINLEESLSGISIFNPYVAENTIERLAKTVRQVLEKKEEKKEEKKIKG